MQGKPCLSGNTDLTKLLVTREGPSVAWWAQRWSPASPCPSQAWPGDAGLRGQGFWSDGGCPTASLPQISPPVVPSIIPFSFPSLKKWQNSSNLSKTSP